MLFIVKTLISALVIAGASQLAKYWSFWSSILISLPLVSILTLSWVYFEQRDLEDIQKLSLGILWAVIPSLVFFLALTAAIKWGAGFPLAMGLSCLTTFGAYVGWIWILGRFGVRI